MVLPQSKQSEKDKVDGEEDELDQCQANDKMPSHLQVQAA